MSFAFLSSELALAQAKFKLGDRTVSQEEYEAALPYISMDRVRLRDLPSVKFGKILGSLSKGTILNVHYVTEKKDFINGDLYPWYQVQLRHDPQQMGWVYGKYVAFREGYDESFWSIWLFPASHLNRRVYIRQLLSYYLKSDSYSVPATWIAGKKPYKVTKTGIWYLENDDWQRYKTAFGEVGILYNKERDSYPVFSLDIVVPGTNLFATIGDTLDSLRSALGKDYSIKGDMLTYDFDGDLDSYYLRFKIEKERITEIEALQYYD